MIYNNSENVQLFLNSFDWEAIGIVIYIVVKPYGKTYNTYSIRNSENRGPVSKWLYTQNCTRASRPSYSFGLWHGTPDCYQAPPLSTSLPLTQIITLFMIVFGRL